jgi:hypothetical protein
MQLALLAKSNCIGFVCHSQTLVGAVKVYTPKGALHHKVKNPRTSSPRIFHRRRGPAHADAHGRATPGSMLLFADPIVKERLDSRRLLPSTAWTRHSSVVYGWIQLCQAQKDESEKIGGSGRCCPDNTRLCRMVRLANGCGHLLSASLPYDQSAFVVLLMGSGPFCGGAMPGPGTITGSLPGSISTMTGGWFAT